MKIAICVPSWPAGFAANGIVTYASYLVPALRALGHEVFVLTRWKIVEDGDPFTIDLGQFVSNATLWHKAMWRVTPDSSLYKVATSTLIYAINDLLAKHKVDVLEMEESFGWPYEICRLNLLPVVVRLHGPWFLNGQFSDFNAESSKNIRRQELEGRGIRAAQYVTAPAAQVLAETRKHYGLELAASKVIASPIESEPSLTWNIDSCSSNTFLFVGRFDAHKGGDLAIRAFAHFGAKYPRAKFVFVGADEGIRDTGGSLLRYQEFARTNLPKEIQSRIEFRGSLTHADVMALRGTCFATVFASRYEVVGYTVLEAMALGCPIVATAVGGVPEMIENWQNGLLVPPNDVTAISVACQFLLDNPDVAVRIGREAFQYCRQFHDPSILAKQTIDAYCEAVGIFKSRSRTTKSRVSRFGLDY